MRHDLVIVVPARGGSQRLPGKNQMVLAGKSLLAHTAASISGAGLIAPVLLTTDDDRIADEGERLGWRVPFRRPAALATAEAPTINAVIHVLDWFRGHEGTDPDAIMVLQPTSPLRGSSCLSAATAVLRARPDVDSVVGMTALHFAAKFVFTCSAEGIAAPLSNDSRSPVYVPNGALYLTRTAKLRNEGTLYAGRVFPLVFGPERSVDIDTEADFRLAEAILSMGLPPESSDFAPAPESL